MKKFHLVHIIPSGLHIFQGYREIIESIQWGLEQLGAQATYAVNAIDRETNDCANIVFGAQMLGVEILQRLPSNTIIYNLEQLAGARPDELRDSLRYCGENFQIWDYSEFNIPTWQGCGSARRPRHVPVGYAPILSRIPKPATQEIDVLFYGGVGGARLPVFRDLCMKSVKTVFAHGFYGKFRDDLIANSKIVLNISQYPQLGVFEIARVSYLLANSKAILSDYTPASKIEADMRKAVQFLPVEHVVQGCLELLANDAQRCALEKQGFEIMRARDIRKTLSDAMLDR